MVGEPKYVPAELYWFLNELLKKTKNDVVIAGWKALFGKDLNPTQIRYLKNKYGNDDVYNAPLSNKRLAYKWPEEAHQLCPGYKRDQRPDSDSAEAHNLLAEKLLPYGVEANLCPEYPSTDYMRKVESEGTPYHGPHLPTGSVTFGRALKDGPPAQGRGRQKSDAGPSSSAARPGSTYMSRSYPGSSRLAAASGTSSLAQPGSSSNPHPSIENVRAVPSARSTIKHATTRHGLSTLNAPRESGYQQHVRQQIPDEVQGQQMSCVDARQHHRQQGQQTVDGPRQLTQAQYQQIMAGRAVQDLNTPGLAQGHQAMQGGQQLTEAQILQLRAQQALRDQQSWQAGPAGLHLAQQTHQGAAQGQVTMSQQGYQRSQAPLYPLMQVAETGAVLVESDGHLIWSPSHVRTQAFNPGAAAVPDRVLSQVSGAFSPRQPTRQFSGMRSEDAGETPESAKRKRPLSPEMEQTNKRTKLNQTSEAPGDSTSTPSHREPTRPTAAPRDPKKSHPLPNERPRTGILQPPRQDESRSSIPATPTRGQTMQESTSVAAVTEYVERIRVSTSLEPQSATTHSPASEPEIKEEPFPNPSSHADSTDSTPSPATTT